MRALAGRVRGGGAAPLLTWYAPPTGARTELSVRTFANWVDKTANLLDDLGVEELVAGPVSAAHPGHWMSLLWPLAAWQRGCAYTPGPDAAADLVVVGPDRPAATPGATTLACSLHPLGLGLRDLPEGVLDFTGEALAQPDAHLAVGVDPAAPAWRDAAGTRSHAATGSLQPEAGRVLLRPSDPWGTLVAAVLAPVLGGGSAVVVDGPADAAELHRIAAAEHATARLA